ncbi:unnamed protein product [Triticum turgidum subsp. durum]|uniref:Uncharacterized protein n=1 Tax=Triticum turgidum subsp. durum TaxID=4567 RepID=A0A9R0XUZ3_TRITD|nr:unnamed protein product [Triticum turgidum subsp. durum]
MPRLQVRSFCSSFSSRAYDLLNELQGHLDSRTLRPELARQLFDEMLRQPVPVSARALNGLFAALARAPPSTACTDGPALAVDLFNHMARAGRRRMTGPTVHTYNILIDCCHRACRPDLGPAFFGCLLKTGITMSAITYSSLFKFLCDMRRTKEALNVLLHRMPDDLPNVISYSVILKSFCDSGRSQLALDLLRVMAKKGGDHSPDVMAYNMVMDGLFKEDLGPAFFGCLLKTGITTDVITYSSLLQCFCDMKRTEEALDLLLHRVSDNLPDAISYSVILKSFCDNGRSQCALDLLQMMAKKGADHSPNVVSYNLVINGFFKEGEISKACDLFHEMIQQGLIQGFLTTGQLKEAFRLLKVMRSQGVMPSVVTCTSVMDYLCKHGRIKEAEETFYSMAVSGRKPDTVSYSIMLLGYAIEGSLVKMIDLCEMMARDGVVPDLRCFNILIKAYAKYGRMDVAMLFFEDMLKQGVKPNGFTYLIVISAFCKMGRMDDAMEKFNEMIDMGVPLDTEVYMCMVEGYFNHGDSMKAEEFITKMKNRDIHHKPWKVGYSAYFEFPQGTGVFRVDSDLAD